MHHREEPTLRPEEEARAERNEAMAAAAEAPVLPLSGEVGLEALEALMPRALEALAKGTGLVLDLSRASLPGSAFLQFACACHRSFAASGKSFAIVGIGEQAARLLKDLGVSRDAADACSLGKCPLLEAFQP